MASDAADLPSAGAGEDDQASAGADDETSNKRVPLDTLARLFPQVKRSLLKSTLDKSKGDVLRAIEQLVYSHNNNPTPRSPVVDTHSAGGKRKSADNAVGAGVQQNKQPRYAYQHHPQADPSASAGFPWMKNNLGAPGSPPSFSAVRPPLFPLHQSGYFPAAAAAAAFAASGYGASAAAANTFLSSANFLRPDYPVFPGMSSMLTGGPTATESGIINSAYAAYHHPAAALHQQQQAILKQETSSSLTSSELALVEVNNHSSPSPTRSDDRSDPRSPYSD